MSDLGRCWNSVLKIWGEEAVYKAANEYGLDIDYYDEHSNISEDDIPELFSELFAFVNDELAPGNHDKARRFFAEGGMSEEDIDEIISTID